MNILRTHHDANDSKHHCDLRFVATIFFSLPTGTPFPVASGAVARPQILFKGLVGLLGRKPQALANDIHGRLAEETGPDPPKQNNLVC